MKKLTVMQRKDMLCGMAFVAPATIGLAIFFIIPFFVSIWYSFTFGIGGTSFVGLSNYISVFNSEAYRTAVSNTAKFIAVGCPVLIVLSFFTAQILMNTFPLKNFFKSLLVFPMIMPVAATVTIVTIFFDDDGAVNFFMSLFKLSSIEWLNSNATFWILILLYWWKNIGYTVILQLSGLNSIPREYYEAAEISGANYFQKLIYITLPQIKPTLFFVVVISVVNSFKCFREAFILGGTRPNNSIYMLQHFLNNNFQNLNYQRLSVAALMVFIVIFIPVYMMYKSTGNLTEKSSEE